MRGTLGRADRKAKFAQMFSNNPAVNTLARARVLLFASRDVWFTIGLPVFLYTELGWGFWKVGGFLAIWVIGYGIVQASVPSFLKGGRHAEPTGATAVRLAFLLAAFPAGIAIALRAGADPTIALTVGLVAFGVVFAVNSAVHSFLILSYADRDKVAMNVGFYYMANAAGRLVGLLLSGALYELWGLNACLWASAAFVLGAGVFSLSLPQHTSREPALVGESQLAADAPNAPR
jgi:MFS family permease